MSKVTIDKIEFYITNVCNLTCQHCNRFNDYKFAGWQRWSDYKEDYHRWANWADFKQITILGGEPLLNPTIIDWATGIAELWPDRGIQILTNGVHLNRVPGLYKTLQEHSRLWLGVSLHNEDDEPAIFEEVTKFLKQPYTVQEGRTNNEAGADYFYQDANGIKIGVWHQDAFTPASIRRGPEGHLMLHNSKPEDAHAACAFANWKNYHLIKGKLYKCGPVALFPEFDEQIGLTISLEDRGIMNSYRPLASTELKERGLEFLADIDKPIAQCKFCPDYYTAEKIWSIRKGKKA
jgi:organic radical activating enzyme